MQTFRQYDPATGRLSEICAGSDTVSCQIMRDRYVWDSVGNLNWRDRKDYGEDFWYDSVDRLQVSRLNRVGGTTYAYGSGQITDWTDYDKLGNVCAHWMRGAQSTGYFYAGRTACGLNGSLGGAYNTSQTDSPHQVRQTSAYAGFIYDSHGNQTFADSAASDSLDRTIRYNAQDQAYEIVKGPVAAPSRTARFWYDPSGSRYKREDTGVGIVGTRRTLYVGNLEIVTENGTTTYKRYIGGVLVQNVVNGIAANRYLFQDHLGSTVAVTNEAGAFIEGGGFNAFGERRTNGSATGITTTGLAATTRGFTGHEMLDDGLDVIHMNGRIYDPTLGRFLQPDPVIQDTSTPQAWNAYTYVFNNPYRYTDPTGMIGVEERQWLSAAIMIAVSIFAPQLGLYYGTSLAVANAITVSIIAAGGAVSGGITGGSQGAIMGAFTSMASLAGGGNFMVSAFAGGVVSVLQGGNFGNAFLSAGIVAITTPAINRNVSSSVGRATLKALIGGTVSHLSGGKFANGAATAALQSVLGNYADTLGARSPSPPEINSSDQIDISSDCPGTDSTMLEATHRVNWLLRNGKFGRIPEYYQWWIDTQKEQHPSAFMVHLDPLTPQEIKALKAGSKVTLGYNDIYEHRGITLRCAPNIRITASLILHEIAHDYPTYRQKWLQSEGYSGPSLVTPQRPANWGRLQSEVHGNIESAVKKAMVIYDKYYSN